MTTNEQPKTGKFGEPWKWMPDGIKDCDNRVVFDNDRKRRAIECVNALAGISDPAAFVKSVEELVEAAKLSNDMMIANGWGMSPSRVKLQAAIAAVEAQKGWKP